MNPIRWGIFASFVADADCVLGVSTGESGVRCAEHRIASPELRDPCTDVLDKPGHVGPECQRKWLRKDAPPGPDPCVPWADACCFHAQQHLAVARSRPRHVLRHERVETAEVVYANRLHDAPSHQTHEREIYQTKVSATPWYQSDVRAATTDNANASDEDSRTRAATDTKVQWTTRTVTSILSHAVTEVDSRLSEGH